VAATLPRPGFRERLGARLPFGLGATKPAHFREMAARAWENRDNLPYAWKVLTRGVCDGCALGVSGLHDCTIPGVHLCMTRLNLMRLNTIGALDAGRLADVAALRALDEAGLRALGRVPVPLLRRRGEPGFTAVAWDAAYGFLRERLAGVDPHRLAFFLTARALTNETYYVAQKAVRAIGSPHVDNAARLCHAPSTTAMKAMLGVAASTCSYRDWIGTDVLVFFGSNPANDQPVSTKYLEAAKRAGTRVVLVNPHREPGMARYWIPSSARSAVFGTRLLDEWFAVRQGGDVGFLYGTLKALLACGGVAWDFVTARTREFDALAAQAAALEWPALETAAGLPRAEMERFAALLAQARSAVLVWSMGVTQHAAGTAAVQMIVNLALARGFVGRPHCGLMPIRGHSGVQGGAEMGAYATALPGGLPVTPEHAATLGQRWGFRVPDAPGLSAPGMIHAAARGELELLWSAGGNWLRTLPDPGHVADALAHVPLRVHQDVVLTPQMLLDPAEAVLLLPARTRYEQEDGGTQTTTERRVLYSPEIPRALGEARTEWRIWRDLALALRPELADRFGCASGAAIRCEIAAFVPQYRGIERLARAGDQLQWGGPQLCVDGVFETPDGRACFATPPLAQPPAQSGDFIVSTRRGKQFNSLIYGDTDPLTGATRDAVLMSPDDAARLGLHPGEPVAVESAHGTLAARVHLAAIAPGNVQVHWPEGNVLLARDGADRPSGVPDYTAAVRVRPLRQ
jgi:molybdopterin-dependent oxidoreductase alpha subunit